MNHHGYIMRDCAPLPSHKSGNWRRMLEIAAFAGALLAYVAALALAA